MAASKGGDVIALAQVGETVLDASDKQTDLEQPSRSRPWDRQEFFLPVNGFVWFYPEEVEVINHPVFQRLAKINQLGQAHYVFRGATHKRMEHVLGAVGIVQQMITAIRMNSLRVMADQQRQVEQGKLDEDQQDWRDPLSMEEERFIRLGALLHDIGHLAAGHTLEDELGLFGKHDEDERLDHIFEFRPQVDGIESSADSAPPTLEELIDQKFKIYLPADLDGALSPSRIVRMLIRKRPKDTGEPKYPDQPKGSKNDDYWEQQKRLEGASDLRWCVCTNMIGNTICADLLDYISRDWYHVGKPVASQDRIFQYMEIRNPDPSPPWSCSGSKKELRPRHSSDKFVLALGGNSGRAPKIRTDGISAILGLLERRYELSETVLYHKTKLAAGAMLGRALYELWAGEDIWRDLLDLSDEQLVDFALSKADEHIEALDKAPTDLPARERKTLTKRAERARGARLLLLRLRQRLLYKAFYTERHWSLTADQKRTLTDLFAPDNDGTSRGAQRRTYAARLLEQMFELKRGSVVVSLTNVRPKIAQVEIRVNDEITPFSEYEARAKRNESRGLSGGHLNAQVRRFGDLWRLDFFMAADLLTDLKDNGRLLLELMKDAIDQVFVNTPADREARARAADRLAKDYRGLRETLIAAKSDFAGQWRTAADRDNRYNPPSLASLWDIG